MPVPISQMWTVASYVLKQKLTGRMRCPFVLMLEPLFRCNLAYAGYVLHELMRHPKQARGTVRGTGMAMGSP
jgi:hypothetical protein